VAVAADLAAVAVAHVVIERRSPTLRLAALESGALFCFSQAELY